MPQYLFDIETDGLLPELTKIHSIVLQEVTSKQVISCCDSGGDLSILEGVRLLHDADLLIGHNILNFDLPAIAKLYPWFSYCGEQVRDTLLYSRLLFPDLFDRDMRVTSHPRNLLGSHGLEAWGHRLNLHKGDYQKEMKARGLDPWHSWSPEMQSYCVQDVKVTAKLWHLLQKQRAPERAIILEHKFAELLSRQERFGFAFDVQKAATLYATLARRRDEIDQALKDVFKPRYVAGVFFVPKRNNKTKGYQAGHGFTKIKLEEFNPASRQQIGDRLIKEYGWKPKKFTDGGQPQVDEEILQKLSYPPIPLLTERFMIEKRIGQLAEGDNAWLKLERSGRIHGRVNTIGAVTGRCTHSTPNVAQVPSVTAPYGQECRELFTVDVGYLQVGADASGLELRCLAHYMANYDQGAYAKLLLEDDIHTVNQKAAGLPTRGNAKTFIYGFLYGAGDAKLGQIVGKGRVAGKKLKENFLARTPALKKLREAVQQAVSKRGYLKGIDGRKLHICSKHAALNTLLQSAGALLVKQATINLAEALDAKGYQFGTDWALVAHIHDEVQLQVRTDLAKEIAQIAVWSFQQAGRDFNWRCPLDGEAKIGRNWADCH